MIMHRPPTKFDHNCFLVDDQLAAQDVHPHPRLKLMSYTRTTPVATGARKRNAIGAAVRSQETAERVHAPELY